MRRIGWAAALLATAVWAESYVYFNQGRRILLTPVTEAGAALRGAVSGGVAMRDDEGREVIVSRRILLKGEASEALMQEIEALGLRVLRRWDGGRMLLEAASPEAALEAAARLHDLLGVVYAQPDTIRPRRLR